MFELPIDGDGTTRPIGPEGVNVPIAIAPDGAQIAAPGPDRRLMIYPVDGSDARVAAGSREGDQPILWGRDNVLYVHQLGRLRALIERIDVATGERTPWQTIQPSDSAGVMLLQPVLLAADMHTYAYGYRRFLSELHVVTGLL
jgi:hypothetical protein